MDVSSLTSTTLTASISSISSQTGVSQSGKCGGSQGASSAEVSGAGSFFQKLEDLQQQDPAKLKDVLSQISDKLSAEAKDATGTEADRLNRLADKFKQASESGDISSLKPHHHGGHHGGGHHVPQDKDSTEAAFGTQAQGTLVDTLNQASNASAAQNAQSQRSDLFSKIKGAIDSVLDGVSASA